ncbi:MAG: manganese efflux pump MntP family protein [Thomasclavelia sp.]|jgi:putative Mn2+ efflux pump MntP|nr:manganese efflux pump MntP family protein [Thomasclavelia sp.]
MPIFEIIVLSFGLAMDATAVSICKGLKMKKIDYKYSLIIAFMFGLFQMVMPIIGYFLGSMFSGYIEAIDHWVAFILLGIIGANMIKEAYQSEDECQDIVYDFKEIILLAIATSIDALAVGVTFAFLNVNIWIASSIIGVITFICSMVGVQIGNRFGIKYKSRAEVFGGVILIVLGLKILLEGLSII